MCIAIIKTQQWLTLIPIHYDTAESKKPLNDNLQQDFGQ